MNYEQLLKRGPYELGAEEKKKIYADMLSELTDSHRNRCLIYDWCCSALGDVSGSQRREEEIPMVPVSMFKEMELRSVPTGAVFKTVTSSGLRDRRPQRSFWMSGPQPGSSRHCSGSWPILSGKSGSRC